MAITANAKKAIRSSARKRIFNIRTRRILNERVKTFRAHIKEGNKIEAQELIPTLYKAIDKAAKRGIIKQNTASRKKSRLTKTLANI